MLAGRRRVVLDACVLGWDLWRALLGRSAQDGMRGPACCRSPVLAGRAMGAAAGPGGGTVPGVVGAAERFVLRVGGLYPFVVLCRVWSASAGLAAGLIVAAPAPGGPAQATGCVFAAGLRAGRSGLGSRWRCGPAGRGWPATAGCAGRSSCVRRPGPGRFARPRCGWGPWLRRGRGAGGLVRLGRPGPGRFARPRCGWCPWLRRAGWPGCCSRLARLRQRSSGRTWTTRGVGTRSVRCPGGATPWSSRPRVAVRRWPGVADAFWLRSVWVEHLMGSCRLREGLFQWISGSLVSSSGMSGVFSSR